MEYLNAILTIAAIHLFAAMSPGPDFIMVMRNSLVFSRRAGLYTAIGLGLGVVVHIAYCLAGIAIVISQSILLFNVIKYLGAAYLIYIGVRSLRSQPHSPDTVERLNSESGDMTTLQAIRSGFITNAINPKVTLFFLSLFTLVIQPSTPFIVKMVMSVEMIIATIVWFTIVAMLISHRSIKQRFIKIQHYVERTMGGVLILFGIKLATVNTK